MIILFYFLIVLITPLNFSWLWLLIALVMSFWQFIRRPAVDNAISKAIDQWHEDNDIHYRGPMI